MTNHYRRMPPALLVASLEILGRSLRLGAAAMALMLGSTANCAAADPSVPIAAPVAARQGPTGSEQPAVLPGVLVTASPFKLDIPAEQVPQTLSVIGTEDIERRDYKSVEEALSQVSSVQAGLAGRAGYDEFQIRGFTQSNYQFKNGLRLDGDYLTQEELYGLERIEVLKGPSSVEYGQIAPGGLVNMVSKRPQAEPIREVGVEAGSHDDFRLTGDLGDRLDSRGEWTYRLTAALTDAKDFQDYVYSKRQYVAPSFSWRPTARTELVLYTSYQNDEFRRSVGIPYAFATRISQSTYLGEPSLPSFKRPQTQLGYAFEHLFDNGAVFRQKLRRTRYESTGPAIYGYASSDTTFTPGYYFFNRKASVLSIDNQLEKELRAGDVQHLFMLGFDEVKYRATTRYATDQGDLTPLTIDAPVYQVLPAPALDDPAEKTIRQQGLYGQYRAKFQDHYALSLGARSSDIAINKPGEHTELRRTTYSAGLMGLNWDGFSPFASYAQSFEPITGWDSYMFDNRPFPTVSKGWQKEFGLKWKSRDGRHTVVASYFDIYQTNVYNYDNISGGDAASDQRHKGAEIEANTRLGSALDLYASYTFLNARIVATQLPSASGEVGARPFGVPRTSVSATAVIRGAALGVPGLEVTVGPRYVGDRVVNLQGTTLPAFTTVDLGASFRIGNDLKFFVAIKNLADKTYFVGSSSDSVSFGAPRTYSLGLKATY